MCIRDSPKGDLTNLLLHFPDLLPADFKPWINADAARKDGKTEDQAAAETAGMWQAGLTDWDIAPERIKALADSVRFTIYTPGSTAGVPLSVLSKLSAPDIPWQGNEELLQEQISGTVTALLGLTGLKDIDPVQSREHILLANIIANAWSQGQSLDLGELIMQIQSPPFAKLGVFDVNTFFPEKDRTGLAMRLNSMLASPSFQNWVQGEPLDVAALLYTPDGRPRHSIFYIAHLSEEERMFFVTPVSYTHLFSCTLRNRKTRLPMPEMSRSSSLTLTLPSALERPSSSRALSWSVASLPMNQVPMLDMPL